MGEIRENVKKNLGYYLSLRGISQKELSERLSVSQSAVTNWIKGKNSPDIETVAQICNVLEISVIDLFGADITKEPSPDSSSNTEKMLSTFLKLNEEGQERVLQYAEDLVCSKRYQKNINSNGMKFGA